MRPNEELLQKIGIVRGRWKAFVWLRGLSWVLGIMVASILIGVVIADSRNIPAWVVTGLQLGLIAAFIFAVIKALILPLRRTPTDTELARFVEEKNPGLEDRLVTAVEAIKNPK